MRVDPGIEAVVVGRAGHVQIATVIVGRVDAGQIRHAPLGAVDVLPAVTRPAVVVVAHLVGHGKAAPAFVPGMAKVARDGAGLHFDPGVVRDVAAVAQRAAGIGVGADHADVVGLVAGRVGEHAAPPEFRDDPVVVIGQGVWLISGQTLKGDVFVLGIAADIGNGPEADKAADDREKAGHVGGGRGAVRAHGDKDHAHRSLRRKADRPAEGVVARVRLGDHGSGVDLGTQLDGAVPPALGQVKEKGIGHVLAVTALLVYQQLRPDRLDGRAGEFEPAAEAAQPHLDVRRIGQVYRRVDAHVGGLFGHQRHIVGHVLDPLGHLHASHAQVHPDRFGGQRQPVDAVDRNPVDVGGRQADRHRRKDATQHQVVDGAAPFGRAAQPAAGGTEGIRPVEVGGVDGHVSSDVRGIGGVVVGGRPAPLWHPAGSASILHPVDVCAVHRQ